MIRRGIHPSAVVDCQGDCSLPESSILEPGAVIYVGPRGRLSLGERNIFYPNASIRIDQGWLTTGEDVSFGPGVQIDGAREGIEIGDHCTIAGGVVMSANPLVPADRQAPDAAQAETASAIRIGNGVLIGPRAVILPGTRIGDGAEIGAGSVVMGEIPAGALASGDPCRVRRLHHADATDPLTAALAAGEPVRLHLGCGTRRIPGFIHIDAQAHPQVDYVSDAAQLDMIPDAVADMLYASHVLEHFGRWEFRAALAEWHRVLKPGGLLRLAVPDFAACAKIYYEQGLADGLTGLMGLICGGQRDQHDVHRMIFDEPFLTHELQVLGFRQVRRWDWRQTEHADVDDFSQAYLPHLDKERGTLMSLNLEAVR